MNDQHGFYYSGRTCYVDYLQSEGSFYTFEPKVTDRADTITTSALHAEKIRGVLESFLPPKQILTFIHNPIDKSISVVLKKGSSKNNCAAWRKTCNEIRTLEL